MKQIDVERITVKIIFAVMSVVPEIATLSDSKMIELQRKIERIVKKG